jgi:hypothetical protein
MGARVKGMLGSYRTFAGKAEAGLEAALPT